MSETRNITPEAIEEPSVQQPKFQRYFYIFPQKSLP